MESQWADWIIISTMALVEGGGRKERRQSDVSVCGTVKEERNVTHGALCMPYSRIWSIPMGYVP